MVCNNETQSESGRVDYFCRLCLFKREKKLKKVKKRWGGGQILSRGGYQNAGMNKKISGQKRSHRVIARFGTAELHKNSPAIVHLQNASRSELIEAKEWMSLFLQDAVLTVDGPIKKR